MTRILSSLFLLLVVAPLVYAQTANTSPAPTTPPYGTFAFTEEVTLQGTPEKIYDSITGDITGWWDHSFSKKPYKLYIEPKPGGGFYEIFNETGDGALHATVTYADRGKTLRFVGPLGLAGRAIDLVNTYEFAPAGGDSTKLTLSVHAAGEMEVGMEDVVRKVWRHFLLERFRPFVEGGGKVK